jgi:hypothetical protein
MSSNFPELVFSEDEDFTAERLNSAMQVLDQRLRSLEPFTPSWQQAVNDLRDVGLSRLNDAILPAYNRIQLLSTLGFLFAGSSSEVTLTSDMTATFVIDDETQKSLFTPTPFLALTRSSTVNDWAIAQLISYESATGTLMVMVKTINGNPGPHTDWQIGACAASAIASMAYFAQIDAARNAANTAKTATAADRVQTGLDRVQTGQDRNAASTSAAAAAASAAIAGTWDPTNYALKSYVDGKITALIGTAPSTLDTLQEIAAQMAADESGFASLSTTVSGKLGAANNLSDLTDKAQARINLGVSFANPTSKSSMVAQNGSAVTYMRSDAAPAIDAAIAPTWTGAHTWTCNIGGSFLNRATWGFANVYATDSGSAFLTFHRTAYAVHMGLDNDNVFKIGGWSDGATYRLWCNPAGLLLSAGYGANTTPVASQVRAAGDIVYGVSDQRLKKDIETITNALDKIRQLRGVTWDQSDLAKELKAPEQPRRKAGLLAQDLQKVLPEAVGLAPFDTDKFGKSKSGLELLNIYYEQLSGLLVEAVKELADRNDALEARLAKIEAKLGI